MYNIICNIIHFYTEPFLQRNLKYLYDSHEIFTYQYEHLMFVTQTFTIYNSNFLGSITRIRHRICAMIWGSQSYGVRKSQRMTFLNSIQSGQTLAFVVMLLLTMIATTKLPNLVQAKSLYISRAVRYF